MVNSKKVAATLPLPKKKNEKFPLVEEFSAGNKGKGKTKVSTAQLVLVGISLLLPRSNNCIPNVKEVGRVPVSRSAKCGLQFPVGRYLSISIMYFQYLSVIKA